MSWVRIPSLTPGTGGLGPPVPVMRHRAAAPDVLVPTLTRLAQQWRADLAAWAIPEHIASAVTESPWVLPRQVFARRADRLRDDPAGPSYERAREALDPAGSLLDVGAGAGAACLPLASRVTRLTAVDTDEQMLRLLAERAEPLGLATRAVCGRWPDVAGQVVPADVVTSHHVTYNVPDIEPFITALTSHARRRVVMEMAAVHPLSSLNSLWLRFHGITRPQSPTAMDLLAILSAMGLRARHTGWNRPAERDYASEGELVEVTRRRLCLPPERASEVRAALLDLGVLPGCLGDLGSSGREVVTMWWEGSA
jgi:2-polyprenyl-3-methyl-5-hydroxy-6-metoxy-1,4-benzoquinol methylase